ncbi:MAG: hypothetical protein JWL60_1316 [Gemmatimonadetes bacterium]|jgi:hypothetical protein|nr:hypothetical protein [Gemmatimonadota bacterium]
MFATSGANIEYWSGPANTTAKPSGVKARASRPAKLASSSRS